MPNVVGSADPGARQVEALLGFVRVELVFLFGALLVVVGYQLLTGQIRLTGLLEDGDTRHFSLTRLQLLIFTFLGLVEYLSLLATNPHALPEVPQTLLVVVLGGSSALYLTAKASPLLPKLRDKEIFQ